MDDTSILGATLGQIGLTGKKLGQNIVKLPKEMSKNASEQVKPPASPRQNPAEDEGLSGKKQWQSDEERVEFLRGLYGGSKVGQDESLRADKKANDSSSKLSEFQEQIKDKSPEEQKKLIQLRDQLHKENYYDPTFNPVKKQEERPAEKVEKEKKQEMADLQQKEKKKPPPLAVVREQNKAEMFRGAAG